MHEMNLKLFIHFYIDVLNWAASLVITQFQNATLVNSSKSNSLMKILIIYDSFSWSLSQRNYLTYKKKLCIIIIFVKKYDYLYKHSYLLTVVYMNHKSLTHFLEADVHEDVYESWVDKLQQLNVTIKYVSKARNKVMNDLSRILFETNCNEDIRSTMIVKQLKAHEEQWIWKNDKREFEKFLFSLNQTDKVKITEKEINNDLLMFTLEIVIEKENFWVRIYQNSDWFSKIYKILTANLVNISASQIKKVFNYQIFNNVLWIYQRKLYLLCISKSKILAVS